jgi:hypothetical protein
LYRNLTGVRTIAGPIIWKAVRRQVIAGPIVRETVKRQKKFSRLTLAASSLRRY